MAHKQKDTNNEKQRSEPEQAGYMSDGEYLDYMLQEMDAGRAPAAAEAYRDAIHRVKKQLS